MTESTRKLKLLKHEDLETSRTVKTVMTADGDQTIDRAAFMLHTAMCFNIKRYFGVEALQHDYAFTQLTWREIKNNPAHHWIYEWFLRTAEDFSDYISAPQKRPR